MSRLRGFVVSHTHWDRAWYLTFQQYRVHLVELVDGLLELLERDPDFQSFTLDGQTAALEDYLAIRPHNRARIEKLVRAGRLEIGPWFVLPDAFLPSGEALIRNLRRGLARSRELGANPRDGYMPDSFGHIAQMPLILRGLGLRSFLFMRGLSKEQWERLGCEFRWRASDGSEVTTIYLRDGYLDSAALGHPEQFGDFEGNTPKTELAVERLRASLKAREGKLHSGAAILFNGCDHMPFQPELPRLLAGAQAAMPEVELVHATIAGYIDHVESSGAKLALHEGELLGNEHNPILSSVWSTRTYLKLANHRAQWLLERVAEPLTVAAGARGRELAALLDEAWRLLLLNHPHDDICGCSIDAVHLDDEARFREVEQIATSVADECVRELARKAGVRRDGSTQWLCALRTSASDAPELVEAQVFFPKVEGQGEPQSLELFDAAGRAVPVQVLEREERAFRALHLDTGWGTRFRIAFALSQPARSLVWLRATPTERVVAASGSAATAIENRTWRISVAADGKIALEHIPTGTKLADALAFESVSDVGDEYTFGPLKDEPALTTRGLAPVHVARLESGPVFDELLASWNLERPRAHDDAEPAVVSVTLRIRLARDGGAPVLRVATLNGAEDHRLRLLVATDGQATRSLAGGAFELRERSVAHPHTPETAPERYKAFPGEFEYPTQFSRDVVLVRGARGTLSIAHRGLHEYEVLAGERTEVALTLLRAVGKLSRGDTRWRRVQAGPSLDTPDAQCIGAQECEVQLDLHAPDAPPSSAATSALSFSQPTYVTQARLVRFGASSTPPAAFARLVELDNADFELSACKCDDSGARVVVRLWNRVREPRSTRVALGTAAFAGRNVARVALCDLDEREQRALSHEQGSVRVDVAPHGLVTLAFSFDA
jgi:mannosylglycerate hydrolase